MRIFAISGKKQSGKNTLANVIHGMVLKRLGFIDEWSIADDGVLMITSKNTNGPMGFDVTRKDPDFVQYAQENIWPYVKCYSFADQLKDICGRLFKIPDECLYGANEQKNTVIDHLRWENMPDNIKPALDHTESLGTAYCTLEVDKRGPMTAREFMQYFGTNIMRKMHNSVWVDATLNKILAEGSEIALITDARFPNEVQAVREAGGNALKLTRCVSDDTHESETSVDEIPTELFNRIIDNNEGSVQDLVKEVEMLFTQLVDELPVVEGN